MPPKCPTFHVAVRIFHKKLLIDYLKTLFHCSLTSEHYNSLRGAPLSSLDRVSLASINIGPAERIFKWGRGEEGANAACFFFFTENIIRKKKWSSTEQALNETVAKKSWRYLFSNSDRYALKALFPFSYTVYSLFKLCYF